MKNPDGTFTAFFHGIDGDLWGINDNTAGTWSAFAAAAPGTPKMHS
ncbi:MAG: hypothetical protein HOV87_16345 [Catenulispora sp.]|nr:hypothetical protein [Catenulispora sp.]